MKTFIERLTYQPAKDGKDAYYTFWVRLWNPAAPEYYATVSGWRYWPGTEKLSTPSISKGDGKFFSTAFVSKVLYDSVLREMQFSLAMPEVVA